MTGALEGRRILIVEDEYFIAMDLKRSIEGEGGVVIGPVGTVEAALELVSAPLEAALLDVNLDDHFSYPVADALQSRGVPYAFLTGYDEWSLPEPYKGQPRLAKPCPMQRVGALVSTLTTVRAGKP